MTNLVTSDESRDERDSNANVNERRHPKQETGAIATTRHERSEYPSAKLPDTEGTRHERSEFRRCMTRVCGRLMAEIAMKRAA